MAVDRLGWAVGSSMVCCGVRVGLRSSDQAGLASLASWMPRISKPGRAKVVDVLYSLILGGPGRRPGVRNLHVLYRDAARISRSIDLDEIRRAFGRDLSTTIGENAKRRVFVHAGVVEIGGGAVLVPGRSLSGKTTLVRALVAQGGVYYSDEFALLDSRGRVSPWAEPLSIRLEGPRRRSEPHSAESLGFRTGRRSLPVRMVVLTSYEPHRRFRPRALGPGSGVLGLLEHTLSAQRRPRAALRALSSALADAVVMSGPRGEAHDAAKTIFRLLAPSKRS